MSKIECGIEEIDQYCRDILDGTIPSCNYTILSVERFQNDLIRAEEGTVDWYFEPRGALHFFEFVETYLTHFQGRFSNKPIELAPFQKFILGQLFGFLKHERMDGVAVRRFREFSLFMGKKNGKSMMGAFIALYFLLFEGDGSEVYNIAQNRSHSMKLSWNSARQMIRNNEELQDLFKINNSIASLGIRCDDTKSVYEPIATKSDTADGLNVSCAIFDESKDNTDFELVDTIMAGTSTRINPLFINISTAGYHTNTVGYRFYQRDVSLLEGDTKDDEVLSFIYTIDEGDEERWDDVDVWKKANPLFGVSILESYFESRVKKAQGNNRVKNGILVKNLNVFGRSSSGWLDISKWDECEDDSLTYKDVQDLPAVITFDLSSKLDLSNVKITFFDGSSINNVMVYPFDFFYLPEKRFSRDDNRTDKYLSQIQEWRDGGDLTVAGGGSIDYEMITNQIIELVRDYNVQYIAYDPWHSESIIKDLKRAGVNEEDFVEYTQIGYKNWDTPMREMEKMIVDGRLSHNGNKVQRWCMENVAVKENTYDSIRPQKITDDQKIDGVITMGMAVGTYLWSDFGEKEETGKNLSPIAQRIMKMKEKKQDI